MTICAQASASLGDGLCKTKDSARLRIGFRFLGFAVVKGTLAWSFGRIAGLGLESRA